MLAGDEFRFYRIIRNIDYDNAKRKQDVLVESHQLTIKQTGDAYLRKHRYNRTVRIKNKAENTERIETAVISYDLLAAYTNYAVFIGCVCGCDAFIKNFNC
ncbi:hypothetical protein Zmor_021375 [Zophobas morio]|uniref:Uncharacterized protein n=1 Tax=Zophobas morio TaxID=2755281 RepID=A0AA38I7G6_9CUCU|nr:hypothetical protein Zmor_021375 [Zophobas morio]